MKIGLVTETYPPETNGVAPTLRRLVHGLHARGHALHLAGPRQAHGADASGVIHAERSPGQAGHRGVRPWTR